MKKEELEIAINALETRNACVNDEALKQIESAAIIILFASTRLFFKGVK